MRLASPPRVILVTDPAYADAVILRVARAAAVALPPGALAVQLRDKTRDAGEVRALAASLRAITRDLGQRFIVNGDAGLARDVLADGVHLGAVAMSIPDARAMGGPATWISIAAHTDADVTRALGEGADAALISPIFATPGKATPRSTSALRSARALTSGRMALYALGGVDATNARACGEAGADGVAVLRALLDAEDPAAVARALHVALDPGAAQGR